MRVQLRIVAGSLKGRKITCSFDEDIRPTPQMVREALFSMLGDAVPGRPFLDVFAGSGANGLEAVSRGAASVTFIERDFQLAAGIQEHIAAFGLKEACRLLRTDAYRWAERWQAPAEPVHIFVSPPFIDFDQRLDALMDLCAELQRKMAPGSVLVLQSEVTFDPAMLPDPEYWDSRRYGRNQLSLYAKTAELP